MLVGPPTFSVSADVIVQRAAVAIAGKVVEKGVAIPAEANAGRTAGCCVALGHRCIKLAHVTRVRGSVP